MPFFRDPMDEARSAFARRTPDAQYPDGYLGKSGSRRERALDGQSAQARKPTDRGVHRDAALQADDYLWPEEFNPFIGLAYEAAGSRFISPAMVTSAGLDEAPEYDPDRVTELRKLLPRWSSAGPGMAVVNHMGI